MSHIDNLVKAVSICIQTQTPVILVGEPGVAKTAIVEAMFEELCDSWDTRIASLSEPVDFGGFPVPKGDSVALMPAEWLKRLSDEKGRSGLFLDEFSNAPPATRAAALRGILDRTWGDVHVPNLATVAAMNPPEMAESGYSLSAPLANRFVHIQWSLEPTWWAEQMIAGFPAPTGQIVKVPENWKETHLAESRTMVAAYAQRFGGAAMQALPKSRDQQSGPWPSYRSWTVVTELLAACNAAGVGVIRDKDGLGHSTDVLRVLISGAVGEGAARQFLTYIETLDLPDPEEILKDPILLTLPKDRSDKAFAIIMSVIAVVAGNNTKDRRASAWGVLARAYDLDRADLGLIAARSLVKLMKGESPPAAVSKYVTLLKKLGVM
jgi:hypothetical protein